MIVDFSQKAINTESGENANLCYGSELFDFYGQRIEAHIVYCNTETGLVKFQFRDDGDVKDYHYTQEERDILTAEALFAAPLSILPYDEINAKILREKYPTLIIRDQESDVPTLYYVKADK